MYGGNHGYGGYGSVGQPYGANAQPAYGWGVQPSGSQWQQQQAPPTAVPERYAPQAHDDMMDPAGGGYPHGLPLPTGQAQPPWGSHPHAAAAADDLRAVRDLPPCFQPLFPSFRCARRRRPPPAGGRQRRNAGSCSTHQWRPSCLALPLLLPHTHLPNPCWLRFFNPVQSEAFAAAYGSDVNVVVAAPTGSGKTGVMELALLRMLGKHIDPASGGLRLQAGSSKAVYLAPLRALCQERIKDWAARFGQVRA